MGELRQRGKTWWIRYYREGRRYEESARTTRKDEAVRLLRLREGDIAKGAQVTSEIGRLRFADAAADMLTDYRTNKKRSTADVERRIRLHLAPWFGNRRMTTISTTDVRAYIAKRQADTVKASADSAGRPVSRKNSPMAAPITKPAACWTCSPTRSRASPAARTRSRIPAIRWQARG